MQFNMNAALKKISVTCKKETEFTANQAGSSVEESKGEPLQGEQGESQEMDDQMQTLQKSTITQESQQSTYSVSNHFKAAEKNKKASKRG